MTRLVLANGGGAIVAPVSALYGGFGLYGDDGTKNSAVNAANDGPASGLIPYEVTTSADSGAGSLRDAISANGRRIYLNPSVTSLSLGGSALQCVGRNNLHINLSGATQTKTNTTRNGFQLLNCEDILLEEGTFDGGVELGTSSGTGDGIVMDGCQRIIISKCATYKASDGALDIVGSDSSSGATTGAYANRDISVIDCLIAETDKQVLIKYGPMGKITFCRNALFKGSERNPQMRGSVGLMDFKNNCVWAWGADPDNPSLFAYGFRGHTQNADLGDASDIPFGGGVLNSNLTSRDGYQHYNMINNVFDPGSLTVAPFDQLGYQLLDGDVDSNAGLEANQGDCWVEGNEFVVTPSGGTGAKLPVSSPGTIERLPVPTLSQIADLSTAEVRAHVIANAGPTIRNAYLTALFSEAETDMAA